MNRFVLVRLLISGVLFLAAFLKTHEMATGPLPGDGLFSSRVFVLAVVWCELGLGVWLLSGLSASGAWLASVVVFLIFAGVNLTRALQGAESCGCFGRVSVSPWFSLGLDVTVLLALFGVRSQRSTSAPAWIPKRAALGVMCVLQLAGTIWVVASDGVVVSGESDLLAGSGFVVLEPESWVGQKFPLGEYIDIDHDWESGSSLVVLYRYDCSHCVEALPGYIRRAGESRARGSSVETFLVEMPPYAPSDGRLVSPDAPVSSGKLSERREWFVQTPAEILIEAGRVVRASEGVSVD